MCIYAVGFFFLEDQNYGRGGAMFEVFTNSGGSRSLVRSEPPLASWGLLRRFVLLLILRCKSAMGWLATLRHTNKSA